MSELTFKHPWFLLLILLLFVVAWLRSRRKMLAYVLPFAANWQQRDVLTPSRGPTMLLYLSLIFLIVALARPQRVERQVEERRHGYDIFMVLDLSESMAHQDLGFRRSRLDVVKPVVEEFIKRRVNDRIGLIVFGKGAYTVSPLTFDHKWLLQQTERLRIGLIDGKKTAIGDGLGLALKRLELEGRENSARLGAFVVLLTDGSQNYGYIDPRAGAELAKERSVKVHTIGAGSPDGSFTTFMGLRLPRGNAGLDEETLKDIANTTGGDFYRATDSRTVELAFEKIDAEQKVEFEAKILLRAEELFEWLAWPGLWLALMALFLSRRSREQFA